ncbi:MAG: lytic transglycosylase domain-containing protein [Rhodospirillales bacterium]|nr:lytic transglycosylase domain-containing protein [Rhodospirillales bacterium]
MPLGLLGAPAQAAAAVPLLLPVEPGQLCSAAIVAAEQNFAIPSGLLSAIGQVESGRRDPLTGSFLPWPWTVDANGDGHFYASKKEVIAAVRAFQAGGIRSIDVGCMQINLLHHPHAFTSLEQAFDPPSNAAYGARFLRKLYAETGSWSEAAAYYHSTTPALAVAYERKVMAAWPASLREAAGVPATLPLGSLTPPPMLAMRVIPPTPAMTGPFAGRLGALMLANHGVVTNSSPVAGGFVHHGLAWYRAAPVMIASGTSTLSR